MAHETTFVQLRRPYVIYTSFEEVRKDLSQERAPRVNIDLDAGRLIRGVP